MKPDYLRKASADAGDRAKPLLLVLTLVVLMPAVLLMSACGGTQQVSTTSATVAPAQPSATALPSGAPAGSTTSEVATREVTTSTTDALGEEIGSLLQRLTDADAKADTLDDVPEAR